VADGALEVAGHALFASFERADDASGNPLGDRRNAARFAKRVADVARDVEFWTDLGREPAGELPFPRPELARLASACLDVAVAHGDVLTTARLLLATEALGLDAAAREAALRFLLEQQTEDGSFGPCDPSAPNPAREAVLTALMALAV
jgi:hypothetical protein